MSVLIRNRRVRGVTVVEYGLMLMLLAAVTFIGLGSVAARTNTSMTEMVAALMGDQATPVPTPTLFVAYIPPLPQECGAAASYSQILYGTPGDDYIIAANQGALIIGFGGNDILEGGNGKDCILGMDGDDVLRGGTGADVLDGGNQMDICFGGLAPNTFLACERIEE